jgi:sulfur carrier protein ThiS adenylyltransferase
MKEADFFSRHDPEIIDKLRSATIGVAGAGGLGSNVAVNLVRAGVGALILADFDRIEPSNLNRQQFFEHQIGMFKVDALAENLSAIHSFTKVETHSGRVTRDNLVEWFGKADILVEALDRAEEKQMLIEAWSREFPGRRIVAVSGIAGWGENARIATRNYGNLWIIGDETAELKPGISPMAPRVSIAAGMQANLVLELLLNR